jgi:hypothetical protein
MSCIKVPAVPVPPLPAGISLTPPPLPVVPTIPGLCCKLPPLPDIVPPIPIPVATINAAFITALRVYIDQAVAYINSLPPKCPTE